MKESFPFRILRTVSEVREWRTSLSDPVSVGFVPTMGALHEGHLRLVRHSLSSQTHTIVSIFLNPTQFGASEDLSSYPSTLDADLTLLAALSVQPGSNPTPHGAFDGTSISPEDSKHQPDSDGPFHQVSAVFLPTNDVLYPSGVSLDIAKQRGPFVTVHGLSEQLEGARRPGFFRGVATVVLKLFLIVEPTVAFFGQKDLQQCMVVRRLCSDLHLARPAQIIVIPTARDNSSGLAISSRNVYLPPLEKSGAKILFEFLQRCATRIKSASQSLAIGELVTSFESPMPTITLDFVALNEPLTFEEVLPGTPTSGLPLAISGAILVKCPDGRIVRLLDNIVINCDLNHSIV